MWYKFFTRMQKDGESYEDFVVVLRDLSSTCSFGVLSESLCKDRLVCGITDTTVKDRLLRTKDLTLDKAINTCRISQETRMQLEKITLANTPDNAHSSNNSDCNINKFNKKQNKLTKSDFTGQFEKKYKDNFNYDKKLCKRCGYNHPMRKCPAYGKRCVRCNRFNHFSCQCRNHSVHEVEDEDNDAVDENVEENIKTILFGAVFVNALKRNVKDWTIIAGVNMPLHLKVDTGAQANVLSNNMLLPLGLDKQNLCQSKARLTTYAGQVNNCIDKCSLPIKYEGQNYNIY
nr:uncharacterized protein LOC117995905 [Maniola hyperantus]